MVGIARRGSYLGFFFWVALAVVGTYLMWPFNERPRKGIDLVGGFYITLNVNVKEALKSELISKKQSLLNALQSYDIADPIVNKIENDKIIFGFRTAQEANKAFQAFKTRSQIVMDVQLEGEQVILSLSELVASRVKENAVIGNVDVLRKRLDGSGVAEIGVSRQGDTNIIIELPSVENPAQAKEMIGKTSLLEIKEIEASGPSEDSLLDRYDGALPDGMTIVSEQRGGDNFYYLVSDYAELTGRELKSANMGMGSMMEPVVHFEFNDEGAQVFAEMTKRARGKQIAVIIDGVVISAPVVNTPIVGGSGFIQGRFTEDEAKNLATMLKSGAFLAPVTFEEERRIGPSLGAESIEQGLMACLMGLGFLLIFSVVFYKFSGILAFITLIYNLLLMLFIMAWLNTTLTLPGIAGMVLTVGMAIDASVLIYEKVREALMEGITFRKAIDNGFSDAMAVILDGNITTFLAGLVLYKFGTGPVQGFAITMMLGIITTLLTGLFFLRSFIDVVLDGLKWDRLSI